MEKYIGLVLLLAAIAASIYILTNSEGFLNFKAPSFLKIGPVDFFPPEPAPAKKASPTVKPAASAQRAATTTAPKAGYVKISAFQLPKSYRPYIEVALTAYLNKGETMDITGWAIRGSYGGAFIPQAQAVYSFGGAFGNIVLQNSQRVRIFSGPALKGNFRLNKCLGYIQDTSSLVPAVPKSCPTISRAATEALSSPCQRYVSSLKTCEVPSANPPVPYDDFSCRDFLSKLNYVSCVEQHKNDPDFLKNEWYVWLGNQLNVFNPLYGKVQLVNRQGKVVSEYKY